MQFTRFLRNDAVTPQEMASHAGEATARRAAGRDVIVIQDTSELALGGRRARANGYGPVGKGGALRGLLLHAVVVAEVGTGALLGLVDFKVWNRTGGKVKSRRSRTTAQKESQCWIDGAARAGEVLAGARSITAISDRGSDIYEHFARRPSHVDQIVRACQNRKIEPDEESEEERTYLFEPSDQPILEAASARLEGKTARQKNPHPKGSLAFAAWVIARLGGWTGYYGKPGPRVMREGLNDFQRIKYGSTLRLQNV
jgi:hypothetical protein